MTFQKIKGTPPNILSKIIVKFYNPSKIFFNYKIDNLSYEKDYINDLVLKLRNRLFEYIKKNVIA
jgi:hypothetical protein